MLDYGEKADQLLEKEEELLAAHMQMIKENAQLLTKEGELISYVQETEEYEIDAYVEKMQRIIERKLALYNQLGLKLKDFKHQLKEEEDVHNQTVAKGGFAQFRR